MDNRVDARLEELEAGLAAIRALRGANAGEIHGRTISATKPTDKQVYVWNETTKKLEPTTAAQLLFARSTSDLTLTTSAQSITGDGDSSKVRILLPTIGDWLIVGTFDFEITATDPDECVGDLFFDDGGSAESGAALFGKGQVDRGTVSQTWKITVTAANQAVELKAWKVTDAGTAKALATHTTLMASIGIGGGSVAAASDHGGLTGLGDTADHAYALLKDGSRALTGNLAVDAGITIDGVDISARDHAQAHAPESHTGQGATATELETLTDTSDADSLHDHANHGVTRHSSLTVKEEDGTPSVANVNEIKVANGTLTDNTGGSVSLAGGGGGAVASDVIWDTAGDIAQADGADSAVKLALSAPAAGLVNVLGVENGETALAYKPLFDATNPVTQAHSDAAATGSATVASRRDHKHGMPAAGGGGGGQPTISLMAITGTPTDSNGCAEPVKVSVGSGATSKVYWVLDFDNAADEHVVWGPFPMPEDYDRGTMTARFAWTTTATGTTGVAWAIKLLTVDDAGSTVADDISAATWGAVVVTTDDAQSNADDYLVTIESGAIAPGGTAAAPQAMWVMVHRDVSDGNDDMTEDARLISVKLEFSLT